MTKLREEVLEIIKEQGSEEEQKSYMENVMQYGCVSGVVIELIYYTDTEAWFNEFRDDIMELLHETMDLYGTYEGDEEMIFGDKWNTLEECVEDFESELDYDDFESDEEYNDAVEEEWHEYVENVDLYEDRDNRNLLAWFSFEETVRDIYEEKYGEY